MLVKCISSNFRHVHWEEDAEGVKRSRLIKVGDVFPVKGIPASWEGRVVEVDDEGKIAVTNPADPDRLVAAKAAYKQARGIPAHHTWGVEQIEARLRELGQG